MKNTKHTKGPWTLSKTGQTVSCEDFTITCSRPNAALIAAAPDMLEALEQALATLDKQAQTTEVTIVSEVIQQAITKAKGE